MYYNNCIKSVEDKKRYTFVKLLYMEQYYLNTDSDVKDVYQNADSDVKDVYQKH